MFSQSGGARRNSYSNALRAAFDNTESRLNARERHVVGHNRLGEALQRERANLFSCHSSLERGVDALAEQNLAVLRLGAEPRRDIAHRADRGIAGAFGKPDLTECRVTLGDAGAEPQIAA